MHAVELFFSIMRFYGVEMDFGDASSRAIARAGRPSSVQKPITCAPSAPSELARDTERFASDRRNDWGPRYFASAFTLMTNAPIRFPDAQLVLQLWLSESALCGEFIDFEQKGPVLFPGPPPLNFWDHLLIGATQLHMWGKPPPAEGGGAPLLSHEFGWVFGS